MQVRSVRLTLWGLYAPARVDSVAAETCILERFNMSLEMEHTFLSSMFFKIYGYVAS